MIMIQFRLMCRDVCGMRMRSGASIITVLESYVLDDM